MALSRADAVRKLQGLRALAAADSGATEAERTSAAALADKLMAEHGLRAEDVPARVVERPRPPAPIVPITPTVGLSREFVIRVNVFSSFGRMFAEDSITSTGASGWD